MKTRFKLWAALVLLATVGATLWLYGALPERIPSHWNAAGQVDAWGPRGSIFTEPAIMLGLALLWLVLPGISPKRFEVEGFEDTWWFGGMALLALLAFIQAMLLGAALGAGIDIGRALGGGLGAFILLLGNVMGKVRRNFWLGIRTPWTLANERVWYATHRLAGKTMVGAGLLTIGVALAGWPAWIGTALLLAGVLVPAGYSLLYYKRLQREGRLESA